MADLEIQPISSAGLEALPKRIADDISVRLVGSCDMEVLGALEAFLKGLHLEARRLKARQLIFDCTELYFMNSSSVKLFVTLIAGVRKLEAKGRYGVCFRLNANLPWQRRSLEAIRLFAPEIVTLA
jgi:hypothetical protein